MADKASILVKIRDSEQVHYEGYIDRITSYNEVGPFDVYPMHANFITILNKHITLYNKHQKVKELPIEQAVMKVKKDNVHIFLGMESLLIEDGSPAPQKVVPAKK
jgi:F0F1-type ATP synthase epsilon subunit